MRNKKEEKEDDFWRLFHSIVQVTISGLLSINGGLGFFRDSFQFSATNEPLKMFQNLKQGEVNTQLTNFFFD